MRLLRIAGLILALWLPAAQAGQMTLGLTGASGAAYSGPGDVVGSATAFYGLRAYSSAKRGTRAINLCDNTGANCADISTDLATGRLNNPGTLGANTCSSTNTCLIKTWYDQTGGTACGGSACDLTQTTAANMPSLTWSCINGLPCAVFAASQFNTGTGTLASWTTGTYAAVSNRTGAFTSAGIIITLGTTGGQTNLNFRQAASTMQMFQGTAAQTVANITDSNFHVFQAVFNGASSNLMCGGTAGTSCSAAGTNNAISPGTAATGANSIICMGAGVSTGACAVASTPLTGQVTEVGIWEGTVFSGTQQTNMNANQYAFWGPF